MSTRRDIRDHPEASTDCRLHLSEMEGGETRCYPGEEEQSPGGLCRVWRLESQDTGTGRAGVWASPFPREEEAEVEEVLLSHSNVQHSLHLSNCDLIPDTFPSHCPTV